MKWLLVLLLGTALTGCGNDCNSDKDCPSGQSCTPVLMAAPPAMWTHYSCRPNNNGDAQK